MKSCDQDALERIITRMKSVEELLEQLYIMQAEVTVCEPMHNTKLKVVKN